MKKWIAGSSCAMVLSLTIVSAQAQNPQQQPVQPPVAPGERAPEPQQPATPRAPATSAAQAETITLTGCIANAAAASPAAAAANPSFELTVMDASASAARPTGTSGSASTPAAPINTGAVAHPATKYKLSGTTNFTQYSGKRVEVRGTKVEASAAAAASPGMQEFRVTTVREVEGACN
jgi:hypothetical protein